MDREEAYRLFREEFFTEDCESWTREMNLSHVTFAFEFIYSQNPKITLEEIKKYSFHLKRMVDEVYVKAVVDGTKIGIKNEKSRLIDLIKRSV